MEKKSALCHTTRIGPAFVCGVKTGICGHGHVSPYYPSDYPLLSFFLIDNRA